MIKNYKIRNTKNVNNYYKINMQVTISYKFLNMG